MTPPAQSILTTLAFFDAQDLPLTLVEIQNYLVGTTSFPAEGSFGLGDIERVLRGELASRVNFHQGFYFFSSRENLVATRRQRYRISLMRLRKCRRYLRALRHFPYLRAVAISGSLALLGSRADSDIDLLVVTKTNRIWLARLLVSLFFQTLGARRHGQKIRGRFCLNHYICEDRMIGEDRNLYTAVEYASILPVLGGRQWEDFAVRNAWLRDFLPAFQAEPAADFFGYRFSFWQKFFEKILDFTVGPFLNWVAGQYQKRRIQMQEHILVSDSELSFHPGSRGQRVLRRFREIAAVQGLDFVVN